MRNKLIPKVILGVLACAAPTWAAAVLLDRIVAEVNGEVITLSEVSERVERLERELKSSTDAESFLKQSNAQRAKALETMVDELLVLQEAKRLGVEIEEEQVDSALANVRRENNVTSDSQFQYLLQAQSFTLQEYRDFLKRQMTIIQVRRKALGGIEVTDEEVRAYYEANKEDFRRPASVHLRHILLRVPEDASPAALEALRTQAGKLRAEIQAGADFAAVAQRASEDPSAAKGGDIGSLNSGQMLPEFEKAAFTLAVNDVSEPVRTKYGLHLIQVLEREEGSYQPVAEVTERLREFLQDKRVQGKQDEWIAKLREQAYVKIYDRPQPVPSPAGK